MTAEIDWAAVHVEHVVPHRERLRAGLPKAVLVVALVAIALGALLLALLSSAYRLTGLVPLFAGVFVLVMARRSRAAAEGPAVVRRGVVSGLGREEQVGNDSRGMAVRRVSFWVELELSEAGELRALGPELTSASGRVRLSLDEAIFEDLAEGEALTTLSLPMAPSHLHVLLARKNPAGPRSA